MNSIILLLALLAQQPETARYTPGNTTTTSALTIQMPAQTLVKIYTMGEGAILMEITEPDGKSLVVKKDGTVTGELAKDEAAIAFWRALAKAFPSMCDAPAASQKGEEGK